MESDNSLVERRKEMMVSLVDDDDETTPILREAYFIKPTFSIDNESQLPPNPPLALPLPLTIEPKKRRIKLDKGWVYPTFEWKTWVHHLLPKFQFLWKEVGIFEAIMSSTQNIEKDGNLVMAIAEKWCPETNTIVFPWGEATITLEDVMVLGGYSVSGYSVPSSVSEPELRKIEQKLKSFKVEIGKGSYLITSTSAWLKKFIKSGSEIEHEAFLTYWIARFVFPISVRTVKDCIFPIAIYLASGKHVALGPAVLASIYNDFKVLKEAIVASGTKFDNDENVLEVKVWSPLCLVQMWAFERFPDLRECNSALLEGFTIEKKRKICSLADISGLRQQNGQEFVTSQLQGPTNVESPGAAPGHAIVMDLMAKQSITQKEGTVAEFDVLSSDSKHEDITNLQDKLADNNSATPPDFSPKSARKMNS
ncbi:hypothetical protein ACFE04_023969 [Oxalis oulophora]